MPHIEKVGLSILQQKISNFLQRHPGYHSVSEISAGIGTRSTAVYKSLSTERMKFLDSREGQGVDKNGKIMKSSMEFRFSDASGGHTARAIALAKKHPGMFGQLEWI